MKGRHGTRMVQVVTETWKLQMILDEPPQDLENAWRAERVQYYQRVEPTEAPRDVEPCMPRSGRNEKALRLEGEASDRMWQLLLDDDEINSLKEATEHGKLLAVQRGPKDEEIPLAEDIEDSLLKLHMADEYMEGNRICRSRIWVDTKGPGLTGHNK